MIAEKDFHRLLVLERKRTDLTRKPFLLMLLDTGYRMPSENNGKHLRRSWRRYLVLPAREMWPGGTEQLRSGSGMYRVRV